ncbi:MAG: nicotinate-nicotinamide nucleotide adenylyltransferase, partial [Bacteroidota bacterium]
SLPTPSFTIQTVRHLQARYPRHRFFLSIGADSLNQFHTWRSYKDLLRRVSLLVARRPGCTSEELNSDILERTLFLDHSEVEISSSQLRREISAERASLDQIHHKLPASVWNYIQEKNLYIHE